MDASSLPQFMTASIPYNEQLRAMDNATICTLNKREWITVVRITVGTTTVRWITVVYRNGNRIRKLIEYDAIVRQYRLPFHS